MMEADEADRIISAPAAAASGAAANADSSELTEQERVMLEQIAGAGDSMAE